MPQSARRMWRPTPMSPASKTLSVTQLLILSAAAQRHDHTVLPAGLRARGVSRERLLASLLKRGLVEEQRTRDVALSWRRGERSQRYALRLSEAGLAAVGGGEEDAR